MNQTFSGWLDEERVARIRDMWKRKLVIKGVVSEEDTEKAIRLGLDGIIVSNHGGRQLDSGQSSIVPMQHLASKYGDQIKIMMDSGIRSGPDIARAVACGAQFTFMGRSFMYGVGALGKAGGDHTMSLMKAQFQQTMEQLCCPSVKDLPKHLIETKYDG
jgi:L-lactate dehydrogenase (cytochrome)